jgi:hypothetical protein
VRQPGLSLTASVRSVVSAVLIAALGALIAGCGATPGRVAATGRYWGVELAAPPSSAGAISAVNRNIDATAGRRPAIEAFNESFESCGTGGCHWDWFPAAALSLVRSAGSIPMLNWSSMSSPLHVAEPGFELRKIASGSFDAYLRVYAKSVAEWHHPLFLRFDWEMNGDWFPWSVRANHNTPADYVAAWRHVHEIFMRAGASNVSWVWCPNVRSGHANSDYQAAYPGGNYVDWTCLDGYNWGAAHGPHGWATFDQVFSDSYRQLAGQVAPNKPVMIGEVGASEQGGSKPQWIRAMFDALGHSYAKLGAIVWFNVPASREQWQIDSSPASAAAFRAGIESRPYRDNAFATLSAKPRRTH